MKHLPESDEDVAMWCRERFCDKVLLCIHTPLPKKKKKTAYDYILILITVTIYLSQNVTRFSHFMFTLNAVTLLQSCICRMLS